MIEAIISMRIPDLPICYMTEKFNVEFKIVGCLPSTTGFGKGLILGLVGGVLAISWRPTTPPATLPQTIRFCTQCGRAAPVEARFCSFCGKELQK